MNGRRDRVAAGEAREIEKALLEWIDVAPAGFVVEGETRAARYGLDADAACATETRFEALALGLFAHQYARVPMYREYARLLGVSPSCIHTSQEIPALPLDAFKRTRIATFQPGCEAAVFATSGSTQGGPGKLHLDRLELYDRSLERGFRHHVLPDGASLRMLVLAPDWSEAPHSSLAYMLARVRARWGAAGSRVLVQKGVLRWQELRLELERGRDGGTPLCLLGTALFWAEVLDTCARARFDVALPAGSRVFETGGYKGRRRALARSALCDALERHLGIPASHVVSEYGMTEMASQFYTMSLRDAIAGRSYRFDGRWSYPAWLRPRLVDAETGRCVALEAADEVGLLAHHDLANLCSVSHLMTGDLGEPNGASFVLRGRAPRADARGCGLADESREVRA